MQLKLMGKKVGMTQLFDENGFVIPVTVIALCSHEVLKERTKAKEGYDAVVLGAVDVPEKYLKDRRYNPYSKAYLGTFNSLSVKPKKFIFEMHGQKSEINYPLNVQAFEKINYVDISGKSKGKGFQGSMKRFGFSGGPAAHGTKFLRGMGSTGQNTDPSRTFKGFKMPGRMGGEKNTVQNLRIVEILPDYNCILVKGAVPGVNGSYVFVSQSKKRGSLND